MTRQTLSQRGFTLIELLVSLVVLAAVIVGILALFDSTNQLASSQLMPSTRSVPPMTMDTPPTTARPCL